ncbi:hypothetical protein GQ54DRAFT_115756 [Martensiomyces pterosporus]|nr:hypothetical protein GQ54DRAFT_115756 [Martensiomyces pterosporus]
MMYDFPDFISCTQCHNSLVSLYVGNGMAYFDFDAELFKALETVVFNTRLRDTDEESTGSVDLYKSAFTSLLSAKTNMQRMLFRSTVRDTLFQVPPDIGCTNLCSLVLGVEVDFQSMLRLLSSLKHLVELELSGDRKSTYRFEARRRDTFEDVDKLQPPPADCPPVSSTLRRFTCCLHTSRERRCYTACYAFELALYLPSLKSMTLGVFRRTGVDFYKTLLKMFIKRLSGSPCMNDGLLHAKVAVLVDPMVQKLLMRWQDRVPLRLER